MTAHTPASAEVVAELLKQLQWVVLQEQRAQEAKERGEGRIPCFLQVEYVYESAKIYRQAAALLSQQDQQAAQGEPVEPETPGSWEERCAALYQVVGSLSDFAGVFETSDDVSDALDVASGRGDVEGLLPWPKDPTHGRTAAPPAAPEIPEGWIPVAERSAEYERGYVNGRTDAANLCEQHSLVGQILAERIRAFGDRP